MENRFNLADGYINNLPSNADLYNNIWSENTLSLLHAPRTADKSALAVDIALGLTARNMTVFYLTTRRLSNTLQDKIKGNSRLYVHQSDFATPDDSTDFADIVIKDIEDAIAATGAKVFIIDNLTRIAALSFGRNASTTFIMKRLVALQVRHKISILVLAHDTSKAGTRALVNLADSEITITESSEAKPEPKATQPTTQITEQSFNVFRPAPAPAPVLTRQQRRALERHKSSF